MTALNLAKAERSLHDTREGRGARLRALHAMLAFAAQEADCLGDTDLSMAIDDALEAAKGAIAGTMGRSYGHDA